MKHALFAVCCLTLGAGCASIGQPDVLYLARHGQTEWNRLGRYQGDPDLDQVGYINRVNLWQLLKDQPLATIYTSGLLRTQRTAELIAREKQLTPRPRPVLNEIHSGIMTGLCISQMAPHRARPDDGACAVIARGSQPAATLKLIRQLYQEGERGGLDGRFPLAESYRDVAQRTASFVQELERGHRQRQVLVVGHGVVNRTLLHHWMGWPLASVIRLRQENDQVYRLELAGPGQPRLSLYTPGHGWQVCSSATPRPGQRTLDCNPLGRAAHQLAPAPTPPASPPPSSQPAQ